MIDSGVGTRLRQLLAAFAFLALTCFGQVAFAAPRAAPPSSTQASSTASQPAPPPSNAQGGVNTLVQPPPIQGRDRPMLFERYGPLDYAGLTSSGGLSDVNVINDEGNGEATAEATAMYLLGIVSARIVEWCLSLHLVQQLGPAIDQFTQGLEFSLYTQYLPLVLLLAAIVVGWTLLVMRRFLGGITGLLWAAFAITMAVPLLHHPASFLSTADEFASGATNAIVVGVAQEDPGAPPGSYEQPSGDANYEVRLLANRLWVVSVYDPWTMIEFGTVDPTVNGHQLGIDLLNKNAGRPNTYDQDIKSAPQWIQQWAAGNWGVPRAMFGLFLVLLGGILLVFTLLIALTVIVGTLTAIVLACLTVPVWLLAPIPGFGQRLLVSWFGGIVAGLAVSTVGALYLVLVLALLGAIQQLEGTVGLITVGVLDVGLIVAALWLRKSFFRIGRHVARLPVAALGGEPLATSSEAGRRRNTLTVYHHSYHDRRRVPDPAPARPGRAAAGAAAGRAATAKAAAAGGATAATAGTALLAVAAVKAGQGAAHVHRSARDRVQLLAERAAAAALPAGRSHSRHEGHSRQPQLPGRVGETGIVPHRSPRVQPPAGSRAAANGHGRVRENVPLLPAHGQAATPRKVKGARVRKPGP